MIRSAHQETISKLLGTDPTITYTIPKYQREYTWSQDQWQSLFDDIAENLNGYFLGSFICVSSSDDTLNPKLEIIDGQQRMTTLSIFMSALYNQLKKQELNDDQRNELWNLKQKIVKNEKLRITPQTQGNNLDDYKAILKDCELLSAATHTPPNLGNRRLMKAFRYFTKRIESYVFEDGKIKLEKTFKIISKINNAILVKIEVASYADAYILFESLNNRGVPLTAIDLMKNSLLSNADKSGENIDEYFEKWKEIIENLGDDYADQERFFRYYYNAFKEELKTGFAMSPKSFVPVATKSNVLRIYDDLIKNNPNKFLTDIMNGAKYYEMFLLRSNNDEFKPYKDELTNIKNCQGAPAYLLLLYVFENKDRLKLDSMQINEVILFLSKFFVRRNLTDTPNTRDLTTIFMGIIDELRKGATTDVVGFIKNALKEKSASDDIFKEKLQSDIYIDNVGMTRYILCRIAENEMTKENFQDLWKYKEKATSQSQDKYFWTIEHILPQTENLKENWVKMIADGDKDKAKVLQESYKHKIGNLTMSGFNSSLSDKDFIEKRDRKDEKGNFIGYKNGLNLNSDLKDRTSWTVDDINARGERLVDISMKIFEL